MDLGALFELSRYQLSDQRAMQALWLKTAFDRYWFLDAQQWWQLVHHMPWEEENTQTWLAKTVEDAALKGFVVSQSSTLLMLCLAPSCEHDIYRTLLDQVCTMGGVTVTEVFARDENHHGILREYGFEVTQEHHNCLFSQTIVKMSLYHS